MKISRHWLREYVATDLPAEAIAETLTMGGLEVDGIERAGPSLEGPSLEGVVVGRIEQVRPHPNADRLVLCDVALGEASGNANRNGPVQIACGAPNVAAGQRVPVATVGTRLMLPDPSDAGSERAPVTIERTELRGERSEGMICSEHELDLGADAGGILVLGEDAPVGQPLADYLAARGAAPGDVVLDIDLTPNRPDAASHLGVARDLAALTGAALRRPEVALPEEGGSRKNATAEAVSVEIEDAEACPRYAAMLVRGAEVGDSPAWLKARLAAIGLRPRNSVVDAANFVMHECGQPLHTFDFDKIEGGRIAVRTAEEEMPFTTLTGAEVAAPAGTLLICDAERPVALAGLIGGQNSEVSRATTDVLIESAYFNPQVIRRAAKALGLSTDASYRFERGVDTEGQVWAAARAAALIAELTGGTALGGLVDARPQGPPAPRQIALRPARANALLGTDLAAREMTDLLGRIGIEQAAGEPREEDALPEDALPEDALPEDALPEDALLFVVPTFRPDLEREEDLVEEVARLYGYNQIPAPPHVPLPARPPREDPARRLRRQVRHRLAGLGLREIQTNSMLPVDRAEGFLAPGSHADGNADERAGGSGGVVRTLKPISEAMAALRPRLLPGALEAMRFNRNRGQRALQVFEFGHVFRRHAKNEGGGGGPVRGYDEHEALLLALSGPMQAAGWNTAAREADFYDAKGLVERLLDLLRVAPVTEDPFGPGADPNFEYGLRLSAAGNAPGGGSATPSDAPLGVVGKVAESVAMGFDLERAVFAAELRWDVLARAAGQEQRRYEPPRRFPAVERDLAVVVAEAVPAGALQRTIEHAGGASLLAGARLFDLYAGEGVAEGQKSLAFALRFQAPGRTLNDAEVDAEVERIVSLLRERHNATLRQ